MASQAAPPRPGRRPGDVAFAVAAAALLSWYNNLAGRTPWHRRWYPAVNAGAAAASLAAALAAGLTADDLGLRRDRLGAGLRLGAAAAAPVAAAFALAPVTPAARPLLRDQRVAGLSGRQLAYQVLVRIPVGTVAWEEIAFRGVLHAALRRVLTERAAIAGRRRAVRRMARAPGRRDTRHQSPRDRARGPGRGGRRHRHQHGRPRAGCCRSCVRAPAAWPPRSCCT